MDGKAAVQFQNHHDILCRRSLWKLRPGQLRCRYDFGGTTVAKLGLHGFCQSLAREGARKNILCNTIAPLAGSRITQTVLPKELVDALKPEYVAPFVAYLCHSSCSESGSAFEVGAGYAAKLRWQRSAGALLKIDDPSFNPSAVAAAFEQACVFEKPQYPQSMHDVDWVGLAKKAKRLESNRLASKVAFEGISVVVTGAGGGLGKAYALMFASLGASVLVNDVHADAANSVVSLIEQSGGKATADTSSVLEGEKIVAHALESFGKIDVLVNNAGVLRDKSFAKLADAEWDAVLAIHLKGTYKTAKAAWTHMVKQKYGRIINTSSAVGLYGNFGQANYSTAKAAIIAFSNSLAMEGKKHNVLVNTIAPNAGTQMTATILPKEIVGLLKPEYVAPLVGFLAHSSNTSTGQIFEVGSGWFARVRWQRAHGVHLSVSSLSAEHYASAWRELCEFDEKRASYPASPEDSIQEIVSTLNQKNARKDRPAKSTEFNYTARDIILYHLGIGFNHTHRAYVYENAPLRVFPTFLVLPGFDAMMNIAMDSYLEGFSPSLLLHGEQYLELQHPIDVKKGTLISQTEVIENVDKGKGTVLTAKTVTKDAATGRVVCINQGTTFNRKAKPRSPGISRDGFEKLSTLQIDPALFDSKPDYEIAERIPPGQAVLYRLSGDYNPLHM